MNASNIVTLIVGLIGGGGLSALLGYILGGKNERARDMRAADRELAALRERQAEDARTFQRDTLLEIHDLLYKFNRVTGRMRNQDLQVFRETDRYGRDQMPEGWSEEHSEVIAQINRLRVRIFDPELRDLIYHYREAMISAVSPGQRRVDGDDDAVYTESKKYAADAIKMWTDLENWLGTAIRAQFPSSDVANVPAPIAAPSAAEPAPARQEQPAT